VTPAVVCSWDEGQVCENANWIVAWMCDRCDDQNVLEVCDQHYQGIFITREDGTPLKFGCPQCQGSVSWVARRMDNLIEDGLIN
jgi:hypothetical protein